MGNSHSGIHCGSIQSSHFVNDMMMLNHGIDRRNEKLSFSLYSEDITNGFSSQHLRMEK